MTKKAKIGFHRTYALRTRGLAERFFLPEAIERGDSFLLDRGVPKKLIDKGNEYGPDEMLLLSATMLHDLGLITKIVK